MTTLDWLQIALAAANALIAVLLFVSLRRAGLGLRGLPLLLGVFFALRAAKRLLNPLGLHDGMIDMGIDVVLLLLLGALAWNVRAMVDAFRAREDAASRSQLSYDQALADLGKPTGPNDDIS